MVIIKKTVGYNKRNWDSKMKYALWADRITKKQATGKSPFELVYGMEVTLPIHLKIPVYQQHFTSDQEAVQARVNQLVELDENRRKAFVNLVQSQEKVKGTFDRRARPKPPTLISLYPESNSPVKIPSVLYAQFDWPRLSPVEPPP